MSTTRKLIARTGRVIVLAVLLGFALLSILAIPASKRAACRMACRGNLCGLCLSIHTYLDINRAKNNHEILPFYGDKTTGEEYWSWRVTFAVRDFYDKPVFRLDEPWNSEYNISLLKEKTAPHHFFCHADKQQEKSCYVAVKGPSTVWTEMENGNLPNGFYGFGDMILIIETPFPINHWAQPGDDISPEEVIRLFEADPGLVKNSKQKWWSYSHWPKNYATADGSYENFDEIKDVEELRKRLIISPEKIEEVRKKVEERERMAGQ